METDEELMNGPAPTANDERLYCVSSESSRQDDILRNVYEDKPSDGTVTVKDQEKEGKLISDKQVEDECLNNVVCHNEHPKMNYVADHTAVLQQVQEGVSDEESGEVIQKTGEEYQGEIENIKSNSSEQVEEQKEQRKEESKVLKSEYKQHIEELRKTLEEDYQKKVFRISDELRDHYQNDMDEKIAKLEENWETEFANQKLEFDERVRAVQNEQWTQCQEAIERVTLDAEDQLKHMKHARECESAELKERIQELSEKQTLSEIKEKELDEEKCQKEEENVEKIKTLEKQLLYERDEVEAQMNVAKNEMNALKEKHEREMETLKMELERAYSEVVSEAKNEMKTKYQAELDEKVQRVESHLRQQYEQDLEKNREELRESSITLKTKFEKELTEVVTQLEEVHERNQQHEFEKTKLNQEYETAQRNIEELQQEVEKKNVKTQEFEKRLNNAEDSGQLKELKGETAEKNIKELQQEIKKKNVRIQEFEKRMNDVENSGQLKESIRDISDENKSLEGKLDEVSSQLLLLREKAEETKKEKEELTSRHETEILGIKRNYEKVLNEKKSLEKQQHELSSQILLLKQKKAEETEKEKEELTSRYQTEILGIKRNYEKVLNEKRSLEKQQHELSSQILLLKQKKSEETEKEKEELTSRHETEILGIKRNYEKVLNEKKSLEKQQHELSSQILLLKQKVNEKEIPELKHETEVLKMKTSYEKEVSTLKSELEQRNAAIADLEETNRVHELEIANLILQSPLSTESDDVQKQFNFDEKPEQRLKQLENEIAKYKKKIIELEVEAEDKFETIFCQNCKEGGRGQSEGSRDQSGEAREQSERGRKEFEVVPKALVEEIEKDCAEKMENITRKLEIITKRLNEETALSQELEEKLFKMENELNNERKGSNALLKLNKYLDINHNVGHTEMGENKVFSSETEQEHLSKHKEGSKGNDEDNISDEGDYSGQSDLLKGVENEEFLKENEKLKTTIYKKDSELAILIKESDKTQQFIQSLKEELRKCERKCEHLTVWAMEQKVNYESEIQLMQEEIKKLLQQNKDHETKGKFAEKYEQKNIKLEMKIEEMTTATIENYTKHQNEMKKLIEENKDHESKGKFAEKYEQKNIKLEMKIEEMATAMIENYTKHQNEMKKLIEENKDHESKGKFAEKYEQKNIKLEMKIEEMTTAMTENYTKHQNEMKKLIEENKDHESKGKFAEKYEQENIKLAMKIEEMATAMTENSAKHKKEIQELTTIIQSRESSLKNLQKMYQTLETSNKDIEINIGNLKKQFEEKEQELLNEIQEKSAMFEDEKNDILENSFQEKEELLTRIDDLERSCKNSCLWLNNNDNDDIQISKSNSNETEHPSVAGGMCYSGGAGRKDPGYEVVFHPDQHSLASSSSNERTWQIDHGGNQGIMDEHGWIKRNNWGITGDHVQQLNDSKYEETERDNKGYGREEEDKREHDSEYGVEMIGKYEERARGYDGLQGKQDEYQMEIELLVEKEEKERLGKELGTMTRCVEVFHDESRRLKSSLYNTLEMLDLVRQERDALVEKSERSLEENTEIITDLIKYEDIVKNLEKANEKLVEENEMLQRCLLQTSDKPLHQRMATLRGNSTEPNPDAEVIFPRKQEHVQELRSGKINSDVEEIDFRMEELEKELRTSEVLRDDGEEKEVQILSDLQKERKENRVEKNKRSTASFVTQEKDGKRNEDKKTTERMHTHSKSNSSFLQNGFLKWESDAWKPHLLFKPQEVNHGYCLDKEVERLDLNLREKSLFLESHAENELAMGLYTTHEEEETIPHQHREPRESNTIRHVTFTSDDAVPDTGAKIRGTQKDVLDTRRQHNSTRGQFSEGTLYQRNHSKKDAQNVALEEQKISTSSSRKGSQVSRNITTPFTPNSQHSKTSSRVSSSFLTSTKNRSGIKLRLVPNLSGVSPIVSPFERRRHNKMLKWQITDDRTSDATTFLATAEPSDSRSTQRVQTIERSPTNSSLTKKRKPRKTNPQHARSRSADDRLIYSTAKASSFRWPEDESYLEKPLTINFEDFVFRHRVKSSEDIANLRDPSPAELWFS